MSVVFVVVYYNEKDVRASEIVGIYKTENESIVKSSQYEAIYNGDRKCAIEHVQCDTNDTSDVFVVMYYNIDGVIDSEVIGVYKNKKEAVASLIKGAHYDEKDGTLRQYRRSSNDYDSLQHLVDIVTEKMELVDYDIYRIEFL